jgi:hypothetical protein
MALSGGQVCPQSTKISAALCVSIPRVVYVRPKKQMGRVHARRVVALMTNKHSIRNGTVGDLPRKPVRTDCLASTSRHAKNPIAILFFGARPKPTRVRVASANVSPESDLDWFGFPAHNPSPFTFPTTLLNCSFTLAGSCGFRALALASATKSLAPDFTALQSRHNNWRLSMSFVPF